MEKIVVHVEPKIQDYSRALRAYITRRQKYWISLGASFTFCLSSGLILGLNILKQRSTSLILVVVAVVWLMLISLPLWSEWLIKRKMSKNKLATLPTTYEMDDERIAISNSVAETKYSWILFSRAFENEQYFLLGYSTNKNMVQFIPKRAFLSKDHETLTRSLIVRQLGEIENIQKGLTGWKLALLSAILFLLMFGCVVVLVLLNSLIS
jgi:hypothetical protein